MSDRKLNTARDTVIYMIAKIIEGIVGVVTLSVYTNFFTPSITGTYNMIYTNIQVIAMVLITALLQASVRYVNSYELEGNSKKFYSTVFFSWLILNLAIVFILISAFFAARYPFGESFAGFFSEYQPSWLMLGIAGVVTFNTAQLMLGIVSARREIKTYLLLSLIAATGKLLIPVVLTKFYGANISWILIAIITCDLLTAVIASGKLRVFSKISLKHFSKPVFLVFAAYGLPLIGNIAASTIIGHADRYIITYHHTTAAAGIYIPNYNIASAAFTMLIVAVSKGSYPNILKAWSMGQKEHAQALVSQAVRMFLLVAVPAVAGVFALAPMVSRIMFKPEYAEGYVVIGWVALGLMFLGITEYSNKYWELNAKTKVIFRNSMICAAINVTANLIFVPVYGYAASAYALFACYLIYFLMSKLESRKYMKWSIKPAAYIRISASAIIMGIAVYLASLAVTPDSKGMLFALVGLGAVIYAICLVVSGEVKSELNFIKKRLKKG